MADLTTSYMGIVLKNPLIIGSSGLTASVKQIKILEENGAAAVVLKSIFEEEIIYDTQSIIKEAENDNLIYTGNSETMDYLDLLIKEGAISNYLTLIRESKRNVFIPVIASINCISDNEWTGFAKKIEEAGADGIELNIFLNPSDNSDLDFEKAYHDIITNVLSQVKIPVAVKIGQYFTKTGKFITNISGTGIKGLVLFNRFYMPDIDIEKLILKDAEILSSPQEFNQVLRWVGLLSGKAACSLAASTAVYEGPDVIKQLLAGADAVQLASTIYKYGPQQIGTILAEIENWMEQKGFSSVSQFKGKLSMEHIANPALYERMQFMKVYGGKR